MVFSSLFFLYIFLPLCLLLYFIQRSLTAKNIVLVCASLVFYAWGEPVYLFLMIAAAATRGDVMIRGAIPTHMESLTAKLLEMGVHVNEADDRIRVRADGKLRPCLFSDVEYDLRTALREGTEEDQRAVFLQALGAKPDEHHDKVGTERGMSQIGG